MVKFNRLIVVLEDTAHHLSVLLLYAFQQQSSSSYWYSYAAIEWHPILLWLNGWMDEDATWYGSRPPRRPRCIRRVPRKGHSTPPPLLGPCLLWPRLPISATAELFLWPPYVIGGPLYFCPVVSFFFFFYLLSFFSSPNLSGCRLDVCHTSTHGVALVRI